jgi:hypothetical protein
MSELDSIFSEIEAKRSEQEQERRSRVNLTSDFVKDFFEQDVKPSTALKARGIQADLADSRIVMARPASAHYSEPLYIVVGEQGEIDIGGRSLGRYRPEDRSKTKRELIGEIIKFFDM